MLLSRWFHRARRPAARTYRPSVSLLEDRTVPSGLSHFLPTPGPATHLEVIVPQQVRAGKTFNVLVEAKDASNHLATGYTGTVQIALSTADAGAVLPGTYTFTSHDHGLHLFQISLAAAGSQTITASDTALNTTIVAGSATTTVNPVLPATQLQVIVPHHATVGVPTYVTIKALDASNHLALTYTGTVNLSAAGSDLPASYQFLPSDHGVHTFQVTFQTPGPATVTATDAATASITGQASLTVNPVATVTHFGVYTLGPALANFPTLVVVVALDASNHAVAGFTGTVHFTSTDGSAILPDDYTFQANEHGSHVFAVTFVTTGQQSVTATDGALTGSATVNVKARPRFVPPWGWW